MYRRLRYAVLLLASAALAVSVTAAQLTVSIPEFWTEPLLHDYELPLATPANSPQHVSRDYYYALPERVLYKSYPIYHPSREPAGYLDTLRMLEPERIFDQGTFKTDADWIAAGRDVFEMPLDYNGPIVTIGMVRDAGGYAKHRMPLAAARSLQAVRNPRHAHRHGSRVNDDDEARHGLL